MEVINSQVLSSLSEQKVLNRKIGGGQEQRSRQRGNSAVEGSEACSRLDAELSGLRQSTRTWLSEFRTGTGASQAHLRCEASRSSELNPKVARKSVSRSMQT